MGHYTSDLFFSLPPPFTLFTHKNWLLGRTGKVLSSAGPNRGVDAQQICPHVRWLRQVLQEGKGRL
jgi:hypothetical protein